MKPTTPFVIALVTAAVVVCAAVTSSTREHMSGGGRTSPQANPEPASQPAGARQRPVSAVAFLRRTIRHLAANDYARAWQTLDPRQQHRVSRTEYVRCESASPIPGKVDRIAALAKRIERIPIPGAGVTRERSIAVTFLVTFAPRLAHPPVVVRVRAHALRTHGRWSWMLPAKRFALHASGQCGVPPRIVGPSL